MAFGPSDASKFAALCIACFSGKSTGPRIRTAGQVAAKAEMPPGQTRWGEYPLLTVQAREYDGGDRQKLRELAYAVAMDLLLKVPVFSMRADLENAVFAVQSRTGHTPSAPRKSTPAPETIRARANGYVRDEDEDPDPDSPPPTPYARRAFQAQVANYLDEMDETARALERCTEKCERFSEKTSRLNKSLERNGDSIKSHSALGAAA